MLRINPAPGWPAPRGAGSACQLASRPVLATTAGGLAADIDDGSSGPQGP